MLKIKGTCRFR